MRIQNLTLGLATTALAVFTISCSQPAEPGPTSEIEQEAAALSQEAAEQAAEAADVIPEGFEAIASSLVKGAKYDAASETLDIVLTGGKTYQYTGVAQKVYDDFMSAESKGSFYTANIKGKFGAAE